MKDYDFSDKVVVVTGSARGIGRRIAERFYESGACLALCSVSPRGKEELQQEIAGDSRERIMAQAVDVAQVDQINEFLDAVEAKFGKVDILVNNAGIYSRDSSLEVNESTWDNMLDTNLKSQFFASQWLARHLIKREDKGTIINIASINSHLFIPDTAVYSVTKTGVATLTKSFANDWGQYGIRVNAVAPGSIPTDLNQAFYAESGKAEALEQRVPLRRRGTKDDIAKAVLFLASDEASYITGQVLYVDGGWTLG